MKEKPIKGGIILSELEVLEWTLRPEKPTFMELLATHGVPTHDSRYEVEIDRRENSYWIFWREK